MPDEIYLDHQATTPCDPRVVDAMLPALRKVFGNAASSQHEAGRSADRLVQGAREQLAELLACDPREVVFTSGATESNNLAIQGVLRSPHARGRHLITCRTEHRAVLDACAQLEREGVRVTYLPVAADGTIDPASVEAAIEADTALVSIMAINNEIGVRQPVAEIAAMLRESGHRERGVLLHCDAAQALPYDDLSVHQVDVDLMSLSAHKAYGPKGIGALFVRRKGPRVRLAPQIHGGGHERGVRSGTLNVPGIVGFGAAVEILRAERERDAHHAARLRDRLLDRLRELDATVSVNGSLEARSPGNLNVTFAAVRSELLARALPEVAAASGSACSSLASEGSYVLRSLGDPAAAELGGLRLGVGRFTTPEEVDEAASRIVATVRALRAGEGHAEAAGDDACDVSCGPTR